MERAARRLKWGVGHGGPGLPRPTPLGYLIASNFIRLVMACPTQRSQHAEQAL